MLQAGARQSSFVRRSTKFLIIAKTIKIYVNDMDLDTVDLLLLYTITLLVQKCSYD